MKPRTKLQKQVYELSKKLKPLTEKQKEWAMSKFEKTGYYSGNKVWCSECGGSFGLDGNLFKLSNENSEQCPHCKSILDVKGSRKRKEETKYYISYITTFKGFQVIRHFIVYKYNCNGEHAHYFFGEAVQKWIGEDGKETVVALKCGLSSYYYDVWSFTSGLEVREGGFFNNDSVNKYNINPTFIYPTKRILPILRRNGLKYTFYDITPCHLIKQLILDTRVEMLLKTKQISLLEQYLKGNNDIYMHAVNICNRNGYIVKDGSMWIDYIKLLVYFNLDTHNAHYVCPANLHDAHDKLYKRKQRIEELDRRKRKASENVANEKKYLECKAPYLAICIDSERLHIKVLQDYSEYYEEGLVMHHCVESYITREESLILSARDKGNKRIATIELSLKTFEILQVRGVCNKQVPEEPEIRELIHKNIHLIRNAS